MKQFMRIQARILSLFGAILLAVSIAGPAGAADRSALSLAQIKASSSRSAAMALHRRVEAMRITPLQLRRYEGSANRLRRILRKQVAVPTPDAQWAALIAPVNFCTDLVRKVCGAGKQCGDTSQCGMVVNFLDLYNAAAGDTDERHSMEQTCVITLADNAVFPACE